MGVSENKQLIATWMSAGQTAEACRALATPDFVWHVGRSTAGLPNEAFWSPQLSPRCDIEICFANAARAGGSDDPHWPDTDICFLELGREFAVLSGARYAC